MGLRKWIAGSLLVQQVCPAKQSELFSGVEKPTTTLAYVLAADILQDVDARVVKERDNYYKFVTTTLVVGGVTFVWGEDYHYNSEGPDVSYPGVTFDAHERKILIEAYKKWKEFRDEREKLASEEKRQTAALDVIAQRLKVEA